MPIRWQAKGIYEDPGDLRGVSNVWKILRHPTLYVFLLSKWSLMVRENHCLR